MLVHLGESAAAETLRGELWIQADPVQLIRPDGETRETPSGPETEQAVLDALLEDARWIFSAMIYGLRITWRPPAASRGVQEALDIAPIALIPRGDPNLSVVQVTEDEGLIHVLLEYSPAASQRRRREGWLGQGYPGSSGSASAAMDDEAPRRTAIERAAVQALRARLRAREYNRPREIRARAALAAFPRIGLSAGRIRADVSIKIDLEPLVRFPVW